MCNSVRKSFPSANCMVEEISELFGEEVPYGKYGFHLVGDYLVPYAFLNKIQDSSDQWVFNHSAVTSIQEMVGDELWNGLNDNERKVLGACLLMLVERGHISSFVL